MTCRRSLVLVLLLATAAASAAAQPPSDDQAQRRPTIRPDGTIEMARPDGTWTTLKLADVEAPPAPPSWAQDAQTNVRFLEAMRAMYESRAAGFEHRTRVFEWQLLSARLIFATVLMLVGIGMVFAAIQFRAGFRGVGPDGRAAPPPDLATEVELAATSVKVSSPVLGVVILVISLAFFYLYLVYVYPITEIG